MESGSHERGSNGLSEPQPVSRASSHADVAGKSTNPSQGGLSRTELAKARLEEKRQRLAQQRARIAAGKAPAAGAPSLLRSTSNASRAGSDASSVTSPTAPLPGRGDGTSALKPAGPAMLRPGAGRLSEALRSPRSRSAAIDVPTSPARALHARRLAPEQHQQEMPPQLPRPTVRPTTGSTITPRAADVSLGMPSAWARPERQHEGARAAEGRMEGTATGGLAAAGRPDAPRTAALEQTASQTTTPRRKMEHSPRTQAPGASPFAPRPVTLPAAQQAESQAASGMQTESAHKTGLSTISVSQRISAADTGREAAAPGPVSGQLGGGGRNEQSGEMLGFGSLTADPEPDPYPQQEQSLQVEAPRSSIMQTPGLSSTSDAPLIATADAQEQRSSMQASPLQPQAAAPPAQQPPATSAGTVEAARVFASTAGAPEPPQVPQPLPVSMEPLAAAQREPDSGPYAVFDVPAAQQKGAGPWFGGGVSGQGSGANALFPETQAGADEDAFWLDQEGLDQAATAAMVDASQEQAAHSMAAQAAQLGRGPPRESASPPGADQHMHKQPAAPAPAAEQSSRQSAPEELLCGGAPDVAGETVMQQDALPSSNQLPAASEPPAATIPFADGGACSDFFSGSADPFAGDASFFEEFGSATGDASGACASSSAAAFEEYTPAPASPFPSASEQGQSGQQFGADQSQWHAQAQTGAHFGQSSLQEHPVSGQEAAGWYDQGAADHVHAAPLPSTSWQATQSAGQRPQTQPQWSSTWQAPQESQMQPPSFGQPFAAADSYATGGQNYFAAGWQAVQPSRPVTAEPSGRRSALESLVPNLWGARKEEPSAAPAHPGFGHSQAGPPPPVFGQHQPTSAPTYFVQPPRAGSASFLPAAPPAFGRQPPQQAPFAGSQWPAHNQQQPQQFPAQPPPFPPQPQQPAFGAGAHAQQQWQGAEVQQWGQGSGPPEPTPDYSDSGASQRPQSKSTGYAAWSEAPAQPHFAGEAASGVLFYPDPAEPLEAAEPEQQAFQEGPQQAVQAQPGWQATPSQVAGPDWGPLGSAEQGPPPAAAPGAAGGYGAQPPPGPLPGLDVSEMDFWGQQGAGEDGAKLAAPVEASEAQPISHTEQQEHQKVSTESAEAAASLPVVQQPAEEAGALEVLAQGARADEAGDKSWPASEPQQQQEQQAQPSWGGPEGQEGYAQLPVPEQSHPAVQTQPDVSSTGEHTQPAQQHQPEELASYQQADWNATQWQQQQQAVAPLYAQPQQPFQNNFQWHHQQQPSAAGYDQHQEASYDFYSQQQSNGQEGTALAGPVTNRAAVPFAPSPRTPSFHQPPAAVWGSQIRYQSAADAGLVPGTAAEGTRVTHGRPPCAVIAWGFGGRCAVVRPRVQGSMFSAGPVSLDMRWQPGQLHLMRVGTLAADLSQLQPQAQRAQAGLQDESQALLEQFPGPLTPSVPRDKVLAFIAGQAARVEEADRMSVTAAMWHVLKLLALNGGTLRSQTKGGKTKEPLTPEAQLARVLVPEAGSAAAGTGWGNGVSPMRSPMLGGSADPAAAANMQALLMSGQKAEALKVAVEGQLWGPALLLARACGDREFSDTAAAMAAAAAAPGTPLSSLLHMLAGRADLVLPASGAAAAPPGSAGQAGSKSGPPSGSFGLKALLAGSSPQKQEARAAEEEAGPSGAEVAMLTEWRANLAILAANMATPADEALIIRLGDRLWQHKGQEDAAQLCYLVAGLLPQPYDPAARVCLLGADHRAAARAFASVAALQRTEVLEWAKLPGAAQPAALTLPLLPYKVVYAARLADAGLIAPAVHYVGLVQAALAALGAKVPPGLLVCRAMVAELEERLRTHASMFNLSVKHSQSSSFISGLGRFLDRGINKLISGGDVPQSGPPSTGSEEDPFGLHRRTASDSGSPQRRRSGSTHALNASDSFRNAGQLHGNVTPHPAAHGSPGTKPPQPTNSAFSDAPQPDRAPAPAEQTENNGNAPGSAMSSASSLRSMLGNLGGLLGAAAPAANKEARLGEENKFFYDKERGMWRERGAEIPSAAAPLPPPPVMRRAPNTAPSAGPAPPAGPSAQPPRRTGAGARYVNTMNTSRASNAGNASLPPLVPTPAAKPAKPSIFVPAAARESAAAQSPSFGHPGSSDPASGSPSPARIQAQPQPPHDHLEHLQQPSTSENDVKESLNSAGIGGGWQGGQRQGMGGRVGSFSQYLSPPVSNGTSQGPPSPPQAATASRFGPPQPTSAGVFEQPAANGGTGFQYFHAAESEQLAGSDYYTSYSAVLGGEVTQQAGGAGSQAMHGSWQSAPAQGQMDWATQQSDAQSQGAHAGVWPGAAQNASAPDGMTELEL